MRDSLHPVHCPKDASGRPESASRVANPGAPATWRPPERLSDAAKALMNALPERLSVSALALDFPHVLNRLAAAWPCEKAFEQELWALLYGDRPGREGFPFAVEDELLALQAYRLDADG